MTTELQQAIAAIRAGDKETGKRLLAGILQADPRNETAWLWMSAVLDSDKQRRTCLERVLAINPNNDLARRGLEKLGPLLPSPQPKVQATSTPEVPQQIEPSALLPALKALDREVTKKCPYCAETIKAEAIVCRFCGRDLQTSQQPDRPTKPTQPVRADAAISQPAQVLPPVHLSHQPQQSTTGLYAPQDYASRIRNILGDLMAGSERRTAYLTCRTVEEATQRLNEMRLMQKELRLLKKDINLTMRQIRSSFTAKRAEIGKPGYCDTCTARDASVPGEQTRGTSMNKSLILNWLLRDAEAKANDHYFAPSATLCPRCGGSSGEWGCLCAFPDIKTAAHFIDRDCTFSEGSFSGSLYIGDELLVAAQ